MPKAKRSRKKNVVKKRSPVVRVVPKVRKVKPKVPKGYKKQSNPRITSGRGARGGPSDALRDTRRGAARPRSLTKAQKLEAENKRLRVELRQSKKAHKSQKALNVQLERVHKKIERLGGFKGIKRILKIKEAKEHRHQVRKNRKEIISKVQEIMSYEEDSRYEDYEDYERDELLEELREDYDLDLEDWLDIMHEEGYTEHEAYELWYGYS